MTTKTAEATTAQAQKAWRAATEKTAEAEAALQPARDGLTAAQEALAAAESEGIAAVVTKSTDPEAARDRIEKSRTAIKEAQDGVQWAVLELHAAEAVHEEAHQAEQAARRAVTVAEYQAAHKEWNDPDSREEKLLAQLSDTVAELIPLIIDRKDLHDRLTQEWQHLPADERPQLKTGRPITTSPSRFTGEHIADITPEVAVAIKAGSAAALAELTERARARRHG
jgi:hypothetical protein